MNLLVCDVDGTLVQGPSDDDQLFVDAVRAVAGPYSISTDWTEYSQSTDSGVVREIFQRHVGRPPTAAEAMQVKDRYVASLSEYLRQRPESVTEVPGAKAMLTALLADETWKVALASGAWKESIHAKLKHVNIDAASIPGAFAEDSEDRCEIIKTGILAAARAWPHSLFERVVYIGDRPWDARAASALGLGFIAVAGDRQWQLGDGERIVIPNYLDWAELTDALARATG